MAHRADADWPADDSSGRLVYKPAGDASARGVLGGDVKLGASLRAAAGENAVAGPVAGTSVPTPLPMPAPESVTRRSIKDVVSDWLPRLQAIRDAWAATLPPDAVNEWRRGAAYVRESSVLSLSGDAPDMQLRNVLALLAQERVYVGPEAVFFDVQSGTDVAPRASFKRLFEQALAGGFTTIGVFLSERLFRNLEQAIQYKRQFRLHGIELVYSGKYEGDQRNPAAWQLEVMQDMSAELHARNTGYYVGTHLEMLSRMGRPVGKLPEAYRAVEWAPSFMGGKRSAVGWEAVEPLATVLRDGLRRYLDGMSCADLAAWSATTELEGVTPRGRVMDAGWWYSQLTNPRFAGYQMPTTYTGFRPGVESAARPRRARDSELVPCQLPALWTLDDYHAVLRTANERARGPKKRRTYRAYLMSGIAYHAGCGHRVGVVGQVIDGKFWVECKAQRTGPRHSSAFRGDVAERELDELLASIKLDDADLRRQIEEELRQLTTTERVERAAFRPNPAITSARQAMAALTGSGMEDVRRELAQRIELLETADEARRDALSQPLVDYRQALADLADWRDVWKTADINTKNQLLREAEVRVEIGRVPGEARTPGRILSITAGNPVFALALATSLPSFESQHRNSNSPVCNLMLETIPVELAPELAEVARSVLAAERDRSIIRLPRPVLVDEEPATIPHPPGGPWLTTAEFAARSGLPTHAVSNRACRGKLRAVEVRDSFGHKRYLVAEAELDRLEKPLAIDPSLYLTPSEFAAQVGLTTQSITSRARRGSIEAIRSERRVRHANWLIPETEVERFLVRQRQSDEPPTNLIPFPGASHPEASPSRPTELSDAA